MRFLDTNIFLRHFTQDHPIHSPKATALLRRVEEGREVVVTSALIIFEIVFTLERQYRVTKEDVAALVLPFIRLPNLRVEHKRLFVEVFRIHTIYPIGFADAYNCAYMQSVGAPEVYSFDEDFDKVPGIVRVEP